MEKQPSWREMLRYYSVWAIAALGALPTIYAELPDEVLAVLPGNWLPWVAAAVAVAGIIGRRVPQ